MVSVFNFHSGSDHVLAGETRGTTADTYKNAEAPFKSLFDMGSSQSILLWLLAGTSSLLLFLFILSSY